MAHSNRYRFTLKQEIINKGYTQRTLARAAGISERDLSQIITGRSNPTNDEVAKIRRVLKNRSRELFACWKQTSEKK